MVREAGSFLPTSITSYPLSFKTPAVRSTLLSVTRSLMTLIMAILFVNKQVVDIGLKIEILQRVYYIFLPGMAIQMRRNVNLQPFNTFGIEVLCDYFVEINSVNDFIQLTADPVYKANPRLIIGGGSNLLFTRDFKGLV